MNLSTKMVSGDTKILNITIQSSDGTALDLTGASITWALFQTTGGTALVTKTVGSGITITDPTNGVLEVRLDPADTASLKGTYIHEVQITDASGNVLTPTDARFSQGFLEIINDFIQ